MVTPTVPNSYHQQQQIHRRTLFRSLLLVVGFCVLCLQFQNPESNNYDLITIDEIVGNNSNNHHHQHQGIAKKQTKFQQTEHGQNVNNDKTTSNGYETSLAFVETVVEKNKHRLKNNTSRFDYTKFWKNAMAKALENKRQLDRHPIIKNPTLESCPKVYIYNLTSALRDGDVQWERNSVSLEYAFGKPLLVAEKQQGGKHETITRMPDGLLRDTHMYDFATIAEYRLRTSRYCTTTNPKEADIFWIPIHPKRKLWKDWRDGICKNSNLVHELLQELPYLNAQTACRHVLVIGTCHHVPEPCKGWWSHPVPQLENTIRIALSHVSYEDAIGDFMKATNDTHIVFPNLHSVPFPSSFHWNSSIAGREARRPPWTKFVNRRRLMSYVGTSHHGDVKARKTISKLCDSYADDEICTKRNPWDTDNPWYSIKQESIFCMEPIGDNPWRKSLSDSVVFGCIPVLFSNLTDTSALWSWGSWKDQGRVLVSRRALARGEVDLFTLLATIPPTLLQLMQQSLSDYAQRFQYSLNEDHGDAFRAMLDGIAEETRKLESKGVCTYAN